MEWFLSGGEYQRHSLLGFMIKSIFICEVKEPMPGTLLIIFHEYAGHHSVAHSRQGESNSEELGDSPAPSNETSFSGQDNIALFVLFNESKLKSFWTRRDRPMTNAWIWLW
jgi:hypothetical protein